MLSLAVTAYREISLRGGGSQLLQCIKAAQQHDAISEIAIVDDHSDDFERLRTLLSRRPKVRLYQNDRNLGVFRNKLQAIARCKSEWVITCDSDNTMNPAYIDAVVAAERVASEWLCPCFAKPKFDYRNLTGRYNLKTIWKIMRAPIFACCFNTGNQVVHRESFMDVFGRYQTERAELSLPNYLGVPEEDRGSLHNRLIFDACDSYFYNTEWLRAGNSVWIHPELRYDHYYAAGPEGNYMRAPRAKLELATAMREAFWRDADTAKGIANA